MVKKTTELQRAEKEMKKGRNNRGNAKVRGGEDIPQRFPCSWLPKETMAWQIFPCNALEQAPERSCSPWKLQLDEGKSLRNKEWQEGAIPHPLVKLLGKEVEELGIEE